VNGALLSIPSNRPGNEKIEGRQLVCSVELCCTVFDERGEPKIERCAGEADDDRLFPSV